MTPILFMKSRSSRYSFYTIDVHCSLVNPSQLALPVTQTGIPQRRTKEVGERVYFLHLLVPIFLHMAVFFSQKDLSDATRCDFLLEDLHPPYV